MKTSTQPATLGTYLSRIPGYQSRLVLAHEGVPLINVTATLSFPLRVTQHGTESKLESSYLVPTVARPCS